VEIPEVGQRAAEVVDIANVQVVDEATARRSVSTNAPKDAVPVEKVYAELDARAGGQLRHRTRKGVGVDTRAVDRHLDRRRRSQHDGHEHHHSHRPRLSRHPTDGHRSSVGHG
jgi:hypothetical protein